MFGTSTTNSSARTGAAALNNARARQAAAVANAKARQNAASHLLTGQMGDPAALTMSYTNRVRGVNRVGHGSTKSKNQWVRNKKAAAEGRAPIQAQPYHPWTAGVVSSAQPAVPAYHSALSPAALSEMNKYRTVEAANSIVKPPPVVLPELHLEDMIGVKQPKLETGGRSRRKTRKARKAKKSRR